MDKVNLVHVIKRDKVIHLVGKYDTGYIVYSGHRKDVIGTQPGTAHMLCSQRAKLYAYNRNNKVTSLPATCINCIMKDLGL